MGDLTTAVTLETITFNDDPSGARTNDDSMDVYAGDSLNASANQHDMTIARAMVWDATLSLEEIVQAQFAGVDQPKRSNLQLFADYHGTGN